jgi:ribonuclease PH
MNVFRIGAEDQAKAGLPPNTQCSRARPIHARVASGKLRPHQEIQRLIGRALRASIDLAALGERQILIDCDVLVADGGTRTAAITGSALALNQACAWLVQRGFLTASPIQQLVAAVSVGIVGGEPRLDLEYTEDVSADVDMNLVALENGGLVEVQGTAEHNTYSRAELDGLLDLGMSGITALLETQRRVLRALQ